MGMSYVYSFDLKLNNKPLCWGLIIYSVINVYKSTFINVE